MTTPARPTGASLSERTRWAARRRRLLTRRSSGIWVLAALIVVFGSIEPQFFLSRLTLMTILSNEAVIGILAMAALVPLVAGMVDLSIAGIAGFSMVFAALASTATHMDVFLICVVVLLASSCFGVLSALMVTQLGVNSLVTTLGVSTVALGLSEPFSSGNTITPQLGPDFFKFGQSYVSVIPLPFVYLMILAAVLYFVLEHTPLGRRCLRHRQ